MDTEVTHDLTQKWTGSEVSGVRSDSEVMRVRSEWAQRWLESENQRCLNSESELTGLGHLWTQKWLDSEFNWARYDLTLTPRWLEEEVTGLSGDKRQRWQEPEVNGLWGDTSWRSLFDWEKVTTELWLQNYANSPWHYFIVYTDTTLPWYYFAPTPF